MSGHIGPISSQGSRIPLGRGVWSGGAYFDFRDSAYDYIGGNNAPLPSTVAPLVGTVPFSFYNTPIVQSNGIGLRRSVHIDASSSQAMGLDALASTFNGTNVNFTISMRVQVVLNLTKELWGLGDSVNAAKNYIEGFTAGSNASLGARKRGDSDVAEVSQTFDDVLFIERYVGLTVSGGVVYPYIDGLPAGTAVSFTSSALVGLNKFRFFCRFRNVAGQFQTGLIQCIGVSFSSIWNNAGTRDAAHLELYTDWSSGDLPAPVGTPVYLLGDSLTRGIAADSFGGWRHYLFDYIQANISGDIDFQGSLVNGNFVDAQHSGYSSFTAQQVLNIASNEIGPGNPYDGCELIFWLTGANNLDNPSPTAVADFLVVYEAGIRQLLDDARISKPACKIALSTVLDLKDYHANVLAANAAIPAIWDTIDADYGVGTVCRADCYQALGVYSETNGLWAPNRHPTQAGHALVADEWWSATQVTLQAIAA